jgi:hypothetical protein
MEICSTGHETRRTGAFQDSAMAAWKPSSFDQNSQNGTFFTLNFFLETEEE